MRRATTRVLVGVVTALLALLALASVATAEEKPPPPSTEKSVVLKKEASSLGVSNETPSKAELVFTTCAIASAGKLESNKQDVDSATLVEPGSRFFEPNCETHVNEEGIEKAFIRTFHDSEGHGGGEGENGSMLFEGKMKYRTTSPKCTYATSKFEAEFKVQGKVETTTEKPMKSLGTLVSGESEGGCSSTMSVTAMGVLWWEINGEVGTFYAERKSEK
jgi:hypothetical protein